MVLPPKDLNSGGLYFLFDSHSRPQDGFEGSYVMVFQNEASLIRRLVQLFPNFTGGSDGFGEQNFYADMYNMFEGTVFQVTSEVS